MVMIVLRHMQVWFPEPEEGEERPEQEDEFDFEANRPISPTLTIRTSSRYDYVYSVSFPEIRKWLGFTICV